MQTATGARRLQLGWRQKALAFRLLDAMPFGTPLYRQLQKHVTRTIPRRLAPTSETAVWFTEAFRGIREHYDGDLAAIRAFEFGAGWDLYSNLVFWCLGIENQVVYDTTRWATADQINAVIRHLEADPPQGMRRVPSRTLRESPEFPDDLRASYGISYRAPADAASTGLPAGSIDLVTTTSVLEHIPFSQLRPILAECHRLMHEGSVMSHVIDYSDHYAHADPSITRYNFLAFSDEEWRRFNPGIHYQNRGRHDEYRALFLEAGFRIVHERTEQPENAAGQLASVALAGRFRNMSEGQLAPTTGHFILRKAGPPSSHAI
jgi:hypothetical protein